MTYIISNTGAPGHLNVSPVDFQLIMIAQIIIFNVDGGIRLPKLPTVSFLPGSHHFPFHCASTALFSAVEAQWGNTRLVIGNIEAGRSTGYIKQADHTKKQFKKYLLKILLKRLG